MSEAMVVRALTSFGISRKVIAREFGVSDALISYIRTGKRYAKTRPDLVRWRSCEACGHWEQRCGLGPPDLEEHGDLLRAGTECSAFVEARP